MDPTQPDSFWKTVVDLLGDAVFLVGPDKRILYWNHAAEQLTGFDQQAAVGRHCLDAVRCEVCEHRCGVFELGDVREVPLVIRHREGRRIDVLKSATVIRNAKGEPLVGIEVLRDMTEWNARDRANAEAQRSSQRQTALLQSVLDSVRDGILGVSSDRSVRFVSSSAARTLGVVENDVLGVELETLTGEEIAAMVRHALDSSTSVDRSRVVLSRSDGSELPVAVAVSPLRLPDDPEGAMVMLRDLREEERRSRERLRAEGFAYGTLVSRSARMQEVFDLVDQVAPTTATVLLQGESGTGKELVAREIHKRSRRAGGPFHAVNCAAIASEILESEFFGHEKGAFTGAVAQKPGRFELAHTGSIFLDEVGDLPLDLQAKLLRVLEERSYERVGGTKTLQVDVRVIAATHRDLGAMVRAGSFREDLYYRLRVVPLRLPSLRERPEDIELLAEHLLRRFASREGRQSLRLSREALRLLLDHPWPGNVRELANAIEYAVVVARDDVVRAEDLPKDLRSPLEVLSERLPLSVREASELAPVSVPVSLLGNERERIEAALAASRYSHRRAAEMLGMHRTTLYRKRLRYGL